MGSWADYSAMDTLMVSLPKPQEWLRIKKRTASTAATRPIIMVNDIDGAIKSVNHEILIDLMRHYKCPTYFISIIRDFTGDQSISRFFDGEAEPPARYQSGLPQESPLSQVLCIHYASALS